MDIEFDPVKNRLNIQERGLSFNEAADFEFDTALYETNNRRDYGEVRIRAMGYLKGRLHVLVFTETDKGIRVISFRKANQREVKRHENHTRSGKNR